MVFVLFGKSQTDTWGPSSGKSQRWDRASGSFPDSFLLELPLTDSSVGPLCQHKTAEREIIHTTHMHVESVHNYSSQNIPDQILLC